MMKRRIQYLTVAFVALCTCAFTLSNYREVPGSFLIPGDLILKERADHAQTPSAGYGSLWVKSDTPNVLVFTDDAGTDTELGAGGGGGITALTGDVTASGSGSVAATIANGTIDAAKLDTTGTPDGTKFLRDDMAWAVPSGSGAVDSVNGQTGAVSLDADDIDDAATTNRFVTAGDQTNLANLSGTNTGDATLAGTPDYITRSGQVFTLGLIDLAADATGTLPVANGGTGQSTLGDAGVLIGNGTSGVNVTGAGTAGQVLTSGGAGVDPTFQDPAVTESSTDTLSNKRITKRVGTTTSSATPTINTDNYDLYIITAQTVDITSLTTNLSGTPATGDTFDLWITGTAARAITPGASFASGAATFPTTTVTTKTLYIRLVWDGSIWRCMATGSNP